MINIIITNFILITLQYKKYIVFLRMKNKDKFR
ncbi:hypothetical protein ES703_51790 [subsurface metagenome]